MHVPSPNKFSAAKRKFLKLDAELSDLGKEKMKALNQLAELEAKRRKLSSELSDLRERIKERHEDLNVISQKISPLTIEHRYTFKLMGKHETGKGYAGSKSIERLDDNGNVIATYRSQTECGEDIGWSRQIVSRIVKGQKTVEGINLRYKK